MQKYIGEEGVKVVVEFFGVRVPNRSDLFKNRVGFHVHSPINSSGVQMIGQR